MFKQALTKLGRAATTQRPLTTRVTLIPGDGIGPEVMDATKEVISAVNAPIEFDEHRISEITGYDEQKVQACLDSVKSNKVVLQGFILAGTKQKLGKKLNLAMEVRRDLDIFANVSHVKSYEGVDTRHKNLDFIVVRETTEGEYCGEEHESVPGVVESLR